MDAMINAAMQVLKDEIKQEVEKLHCETHPEVCAMRTDNYAELERMIMNGLMARVETISIQTAIAEVEMELSHLD